MRWERRCVQLEAEGRWRIRRRGGLEGALNTLGQSFLHSV